MQYLGVIDELTEGFRDSNAGEGEVRERTRVGEVRHDYVWGAGEESQDDERIRTFVEDERKIGGHLEELEDGTAATRADQRRDPDVLCAQIRGDHRGYKRVELGRYRVLGVARLLLAIFPAPKVPFVGCVVGYDGSVVVVVAVIIVIVVVIRFARRFR